MNVIVRRLSVVKSNKNCGPGIGFLVIIQRAFHDVLDDHAERDVAILNLLSRFRVNRLTGFRIDRQQRGDPLRELWVRRDLLRDRGDGRRRRLAARRRHR